MSGTTNSEEKYLEKDGSSGDKGATREEQLLQIREQTEITLTSLGES